MAYNKPPVTNYMVHQMIDANANCRGSEAHLSTVSQASGMSIDKTWRDFRQRRGQVQYIACMYRSLLDQSFSPVTDEHLMVRVTVIETRDMDE